MGCILDNKILDYPELCIDIINLDEIIQFVVCFTHVLGLQYKVEMI